VIAPVQEDSSSSDEEEEEPVPQPEQEIVPQVPSVPKPAFVVTPNRIASVEESRSKLTICSMEQEIMENIAEHDVVFICGGAYSF
jgi:HrpA-like RNA helicase